MIRKYFIKPFSITLLVISLITVLSFGTIAVFKYLVSLKTNDLKIATLKLDVLNEESISIDGSTLVWKDAYNNEVDLIQEGQTYHLDSFNIKNTGDTPLEYAISIESSNQTVLDNLDIMITPNNQYLGKDALTSVNVSLSIKEDAISEIQGQTLSDINIYITAKAPKSLYDD